MIAVERRHARRYQTHGRIELPRAIAGAPLRGSVMDVSELGCRLCVPQGVNFGYEDLRDEEIWLEVKFQTSYLTFRTVAAVRSLMTYPGLAEATLGLQFVELHDRARRDIAALIQDQRELRVAA